jgi:hypothetical protein
MYRKYCNFKTQLEETMIYLSPCGHFSKSTLIIALATVCLVACGGGSSSDSSGSGNNTGNSPPPVTGTIAQMELLGGNMSHLIATATGIYGRDSTGPTDKIVKWQSTTGARGWFQYSLPTNTSVFAPIELQNDSVSSVYWAGFDKSSVNDIYSLNFSSGIDDIGIQVIVPGGIKTSQILPWVITQSGDVYIKSTGGGLGSKASLNYDKVYSSGQDYLGQIAAVSDENDLVLYASSGNTLYRISATGQAVTWNLPASVNTLVSSLGAIWVGAGNTIYQINGDAMSTYAVIPNILGLNSSIFCINNLDLYAADGSVFPGISSGSAAPSPRSFLATSEAGLSTAETIQLGAVKSGLMGGGIYCGNNVDNNVYAQVVDMNAPSAGLQLMRILAL